MPRKYGGRIYYLLYKQRFLANSWFKTWKNPQWSLHLYLRTTNDKILQQGWIYYFFINQSSHPWKSISRTLEGRFCTPFYFLRTRCRHLILNFLRMRYDINRSSHPYSLKSRSTLTRLANLGEFCSDLLTHCCIKSFFMLPATTCPDPSKLLLAYSSTSRWVASKSISDL